VIQRKLLQGLENATPAQLAEAEIVSVQSGLDWGALKDPALYPPTSGMNEVKLFVTRQRRKTRENAHIAARLARAVIKRLEQSRDSSGPINRVRDLTLMRIEEATALGRVAPLAVERLRPAVFVFESTLKRRVNCLGFVALDASSDNLPNRNRFGNGTVHDEEPTFEITGPQCESLGILRGMVPLACALHCRKRDHDNLRPLPLIIRAARLGTFGNAASHDVLAAELLD